MAKAISGVVNEQSGVKNLFSEVDRSQKALEEQDRRQRKVLSALYSINSKIHKVLIEKSKFSDQKSSIEDTLDSLGDDIKSLESERDSQKTELIKSLRLNFSIQKKSIVEIAVSATSLADLDRRGKILSRISESHIEHLKRYATTINSIKKKKEFLVNRLKRYKSLEIRISMQEHKLKSEQQLKNKLLQGIRKTKLFVHSKIEDLRDKSRKLGINDSGVFDAILRPSFSEQKGTLPMPIEADTVLRNFGVYKAGLELGLTSPLSLNLKGLFWGSKPRSKVQAISEGTVGFIGSIPGLNQIVIIDHGDHYYSVYGNVSDLKVTKGQAVNQYQQIASSEFSALEGTNGMYFEIRHFSEPYNPLQWIRGQQL